MEKYTMVNPAAPTEAATNTIDDVEIIFKRSSSQPLEQVPGGDLE